MSLFSPGVAGILNRQSGAGSGGTPLPPGDPVREAFTRGLQRDIPDLFSVIARAKSAERAREQNLRDTSFVAATSVAQKRFDWGMKKELAKFYTSDGRDITPPSDYTADLGFGVSLTAGDFLDSPESGVRRTYTEMVAFLQDRFMDNRIKTAPSERAESASKTRMEQGKLHSEMRAGEYAAARRGVVLANNLNSVVRAYKETLQGTKGYDPSTFALHLNSILEASSAEDAVDPGVARNSALVAIKDLVNVGVLESHTDKDNRFALAVLGSSALRNTRMVNDSLAGLSEEDRKYMKGVISGVGKDRKIYRRGDPLPGDEVGEYLPWAMAQISAGERENIQQRAIKAMRAQTEVGRSELTERLKGLQSAMNSAQVKEPGFREMVRGSVTKALGDIQRFYPPTTHPLQNSKMSASVLSMAELLEMRSTMDGMHSATLKKYLTDGSLGAAIGTRMRERFGNTSFLHSQDIISSANEMAANFIGAELKLRETDPYGTVLRTTKDIRLLEEKIQQGDYADSSEMARDKATLRVRMEKRAMELGVRPSMVTEAERSQVKMYVALGNPVITESFIKGLREKYGELSYFKYVLPELASDKVVGEDVLGYAMLPVSQVWQIAASAAADRARNDTIVKDRGYEDDLQTALADLVHRGWTERWFMDKGSEGWWDADLVRVNNTISDRLGDGFMGQRAKTAAANAIKDIAMSYLAANKYNDPGDAVEAAVKIYGEGMGSPMRFDDRDMYVYNPGTLNEPRIDLLEKILGDSKFLDEEVFPHVIPGRAVLERARMEGEHPGDLVKRLFFSEIKWRFGFEGIFPTIENDASPDPSSGITTPSGGAFVIPMGSLEALITKWGGRV